MAGLNTRVQNLEFEFPDTNTEGATLSVRTRVTGSSTWNDLPASASFTMREPASVTTIADAVNPGAVSYTVSDAALSLPDQVPAAASENLTVTFKNSLGADLIFSFNRATATLDLPALHPGSYTLRAIKTRTVATTTTSSTPPVP